MSLEDVQAGDLVYHHHGLRNRSVRRVTRTTKTRIYIENGQFGSRAYYRSPGGTFARRIGPKPQPPFVDHLSYRSPAAAELDGQGSQ